MALITENVPGKVIEVSKDEPVQFKIEPNFRIINKCECGKNEVKINLPADLVTTIVYNSKCKDCIRKDMIALDGSPNCKICAEPSTFKPSHMGSSRCKSGSLASGGTWAHCTCDTCF